MSDIYRRAVEQYGAEAQLRQLQEECGELIVAINHYLRNRCGKAGVVEEIADVAIMLGQAAEILGEDLVESMVRVKTARLEARLDKEPSR